MKERIILAPGLNGNELIKNLALHGVNCFNTRIVGAGELARIALMRSGIAITEDFIDSREELGFIAKVVNNSEYFKNTSYADLRNITAAINQMRCLVSEQDEQNTLRDTLSKGAFLKKNNALLDVYDHYMQLLIDNGLIDSIMLIRKAIAECQSINADFIILEEFPLNPLTTSLLLKLSNGEFQKINIKSLYGVTYESMKISSYKNCYGTANEVETVIDEIYSGKKLDQCTVAITDVKTYSQLFLDYALQYNIPITFGCGIPITNSYPAKLLSLYYLWMTSGFFGSDALKQMLFSSYFDRSKLKESLPKQDDDFCWSIFYECLGNIKFTKDKVINKKRIQAYKKALDEDKKYIVEGESKEYKEFTVRLKCIPLLEIMADEFSMPVEAFISKYAVIRQGKSTTSERLLSSLDSAAVNVIYELFEAVHKTELSQGDGEIIENILGASVLCQKSAPGCLHISSVDKAACSIRRNLYIMGLSASKYPGSPKENYLLLDSDIKLFGEKAVAYTSEGIIKHKNNSVINLAELASALNSEIHISYSGMNVSELKKDNASSLIYKLYCITSSSKNLEDEIKTVDYFVPALSNTRMIGKSYVNGARVLQKEINRESIKAEWNIDKEYSPSALEKFWGCPRSFLLGRILGIPEPDDSDQFAVISALDRGTLAHSIMEQLANSNMTLDEFLTLSGNFFDRFIIEHPPLIPEKVSTERRLFLDMIEIAYNSDPHREVVLKEEDIHCTHETGVKLHGFPDRVEKLEDGTYLIVDYKSSSKLRHTENDIVSCLQVVIYAYLMESMNYKVSGCEYRYIKINKTVKCKYDDEIKAKLTKILNKFKDMMLSGYFPCGTACEFCKYGSICGKNSEDDIWSGNLFDDANVLGGD